MSQTLTSVALAGSTGLVGAQILKVLTDLPSALQVSAFARKPLPHKGANTHEFVDTDSSKWLSQLKDLKPTPDAFFTALGTTRASAGSLEKQKLIDHDLNVDLAKAARENGTRIAVLISSNGANAKSMIPYTKMKGETEEAFQEMGFSHTVILRPGLLLGTRTESRPMEAFSRKIAGGLGAISSKLTDFWAQDSLIIARAAVSAATQCAEGHRKDGVWILDQAEIVKLGRTEWQENEVKPTGP